MSKISLYFILKCVDVLFTIRTELKFLNYITFSLFDCCSKLNFLRNKYSN